MTLLTGLCMEKSHRCATAVRQNTGPQAWSGLLWGFRATGRIGYHPARSTEHEYHRFMTNTSTVILVPFLLAFVVFALRFYNREGASGMTRPSFLLAILTVLIAFSYLMLGITNNLPPYGTIGFAVVGLILLGTAILRMFMI